MSYTVTAPLVLAKDRVGRIHHKYEGETIDWLSDDQRELFLSARLVERVEPAPGDEHVSGHPESIECHDHKVRTSA